MFDSMSNTAFNGMIVVGVLALLLIGTMLGAWALDRRRDRAKGIVGRPAKPEPLPAMTDHEFAWMVEERNRRDPLYLEKMQRQANALRNTTPAERDTVHNRRMMQNAEIHRDAPLIP